ncbi:hypothetical protein TELCIR_03080 [Teladorsagia circumcincta]|uniref:Uncharacterized protein n=1 Tax=Teladorsagia circumcincta TaxID=45464 RepID=A0A2G9UXD1_TELCI|nr:hypothetical protein TELCIR_03080 [Teladorsagia circumcincta]
MPPFSVTNFSAIYSGSLRLPNIDLQFFLKCDELVCIA